MTIENIAKKLNINKSTVSRALRGRSGVHPDTRQRCIRLAGELGYPIPKDADTHNVALILPAKSVDEVHELAHRSMIAISNEITRIDWQVSFVVVPMLKTSLLDNQKTWPTGLLRANIDSCIVEGMISPESRRMLASYFANHVVMLSRHYLQGGLSGVGIDNYEGGNFAAEKALAAGHPRIGWIGSLGSQDISRERYYGVCNCLAKAGMELSIEIWLDERAPLDTDMIDAVIAPKFPDDPAQRPTVWISSTDWLGAMVMLYFEKRNLFCPEDFSMICFDDTKIAEALVRRELTSVISPITRMAVGAVQMLACGWNGQLDDPAAWLYPFEYREGTTLKQYKR